MSVSSMRFKGQVAVITGAASGLGAAVARQLIDGGAHVVLNYRQALGELDKLLALARECKVTAIVSQGDVSQIADCQALAQAAQSLGHVDILINNAGATVHVPASELDALNAEHFQHIFGVNVIGPYQVTRALLPLLQLGYERAGKARAVVMVSSVSAFLGNGSSIAYSASKAALNNLSLSLARTLAPAIRVNAVCPGYIDTAWFSKGVGDRVAQVVREKVSSNVPLRQVATSESVARAVLSLCSEDMSNVTGTTLVVDDGLSLLTASG